MIESQLDTAPHVQEKNGWIVMFSLLILVLDGSLFFIPLPLWQLMSLHAMLIACVVGNAFYFEYREWDRRFSLLLALFFITMGVAGIILLLIVIILYLIYENFMAYSEAELMESLFPKIVLEKREIIYERLVYGAEDAAQRANTASFQDIMVFGSEKQKRATIEKILKHFHPEFFPALFLALNDRSNSVRIHAATAITSLDKQFYDRYLIFEKKIRQNPEDSYFLLDLAKHCEMYANSRILDADRERKMREEAIKAYVAYLKLKPEGFEFYLPLAQLFLANQQPQEAKSWLEPLIARGELNPEIYIAWMQALFDLQELAELRRFSTQIPEACLQENNTTAQTLKDYVLLWMPKEKLS